jgi:hypothetical protein
VGDDLGAPEHVGIVTAVVSGKITVVEGNKSDAVGKRVIPVNGQYIRGYGLPNYAALATVKEQTPDDITLANVVADIGLSSPAYWRDVLSGEKTASAINIKALMDKYHDALIAARKR